MILALVVLPFWMFVAVGMVPPFLRVNHLVIAVGAILCGTQSLAAFVVEWTFSASIRRGQILLFFVLAVVEFGMIVSITSIAQSLIPVPVIAAAGAAIPLVVRRTAANLLVFAATLSAGIQALAGAHFQINALIFLFPVVTLIGLAIVAEIVEKRCRPAAFASPVSFMDENEQPRP